MDNCAFPDMNYMYKPDHAAPIHWVQDNTGGMTDPGSGTMIQASYPYPPPIRYMIPAPPHPSLTQQIVWPAPYYAPTYQMPAVAFDPRFVAPPTLSAASYEQPAEPTYRSQETQTVPIKRRPQAIPIIDPETNNVISTHDPSPKRRQTSPKQWINKQSAPERSFPPIPVVCQAAPQNFHFTYSSTAHQLTFEQPQQTYQAAKSYNGNNYRGTGSYRGGRGNSRGRGRGARSPFPKDRYSQYDRNTFASDKIHRDIPAEIPVYDQQIKKKMPFSDKSIPKRYGNQKSYQVDPNWEVQKPKLKNALDQKAIPKTSLEDTKIKLQDSKDQKMGQLEFVPQQPIAETDANNNPNHEMQTNLEPSVPDIGIHVLPENPDAPSFEMQSKLEPPVLDVGIHDLSEVSDAPFNFSSFEIDESFKFSGAEMSIDQEKILSEVAEKDSNSNGLKTPEIFLPLKDKMGTELESREKDAESLESGAKIAELKKGAPKMEETSPEIEGKTSEVQVKSPGNQAVQKREMPEVPASKKGN